MSSKKCALCWNESHNENKIFIPMPHAIRDTKRRHDWFGVYKDALEYTTKDCYLCEDHFNLKEDTVNYDLYMTKKAKRLIFKANALPTSLTTTPITNFDNYTEIRNIEEEPVNVQIKEEPMDIKTENFVEYEENNDQSIINNNSVNYYTQTVDNVINLNNYSYVNNVAYVNNDNNMETFNSYDNGMNGNIVLNNQNILAMIQSGELKIVQVMPTMAQASTSNVTTTTQSGNTVPQLVYLNNAQQTVVQQQLPQQYQQLLPAFVDNVQVKTELTEPIVTANNVVYSGIVNNSNVVVNNNSNVAKPIRNVYACAKCHELFYTIEERNLHYLVKHIRGNLAGQKKPNTVHVKQEFIEEEKKKTQVLVRKLTKVVVVGQKASVKQDVVLNGMTTQMVTDVVKKQRKSAATVKRKLSSGGEMLDGGKKNRQMIRTAGNGGGSLSGTEVNKPISITNDLQCITCGHQADNADQLQEHRSLHDVFKCVICHQTLEKRIYANHMLEHREEPPGGGQTTFASDMEDLTTLSTNRVFQQRTTWQQDQQTRHSVKPTGGKKRNEENTVEDDSKTTVSSPVGKKKRPPSTAEVPSDCQTLQHCDKCGKLFSSKHVMKQHRRSCLLDGNFKCQVCLEEFKTKWLFTDHQRAKHCSRLVQCAYCNIPRMNRESYPEHVRTVHPLAQTRHECSLCHIHFPSEQAYRTHLTTAHRDTYQKTLTKFKNTHGHSITAFKPSAGNPSGAVDTATLRYGQPTPNVKFNLETIENIKQAIVTRESVEETPSIALEDIGKTDFSKLVTVRIAGQAYRTFKTDSGTIKLVRIDNSEDKDNSKTQPPDNSTSSEPIIKISADSNDPFKRLVYGCQFCDATFRSKNVLRQHYMRRHSNTVTAGKSDSVTASLPVLVKPSSSRGKQTVVLRNGGGKVRTPTPPPPLVKYNHDDEKVEFKLEEEEKVEGYKLEEFNLEEQKLEEYEEKLEGNVYEEGNYGEDLNEEHLNEENIHEENIHEEHVNAEELANEEITEELVDEELLEEEHVNTEELVDEEDVNTEELIEEHVDSEELVDADYDEADIEEEIVEEESNEQGEVIPEGTTEQRYYLDSEELVFENDTPDFVNVNLMN